MLQQFKITFVKLRSKYLNLDKDKKTRNRNLSNVFPSKDEKGWVKKREKREKEIFRGSANAAAFRKR